MLGAIQDIWSTLPKEIKIIFGISIFLYAGSLILQGIIFLWNIAGIPLLNAVNGCYTGAIQNCIPPQNGLFIFGINFADYWVITALIFFPTLMIFAIKWYSLILNWGK